MPERILAENKIQNNSTSELDEMMKAGLHFGHKTSKTHPKMKPYIAGVRNTVHIIDLEKTKTKLQEALACIKNLVSEGKILFLIGTKIQVKQLVEETAKVCNLPYVSERWIGGTFSNFDTILKRVEYLKEIEKKKTEGELEKYTKKEQVKIEEELRLLKMKFGGIQDVTRLPDAVLVCDPDRNELAIKEAKRKGITVIAICDTNIDPTKVDYPIPANDDAISSVKYILDKVRDTIIAAKLPTIQSK